VCAIVIVECCVTVDQEERSLLQLGSLLRFLTLFLQQTQDTG